MRQRHRAAIAAALLLGALLTASVALAGGFGLGFGVSMQDQRRGAGASGVLANCVLISGSSLNCLLVSGTSSNDLLVQ